MAILKTRLPLHALPSRRTGGRALLHEHSLFFGSSEALRLGSVAQGKERPCQDRFRNEFSADAQQLMTAEPVAKDGPSLGHAVHPSSGAKKAVL